MSVVDDVTRFFSKGFHLDASRERAHDRAKHRRRDLAVKRQQSKPLVVGGRTTKAARKRAAAHSMLKNGPGRSSS